MEIGTLPTLLGILTVILSLYYYFLRLTTFDFWQSRGIPGPRPVAIYGNLKEIIFGKMSVGDLVVLQYEKHKHQPMFGIYAMRSPILVINDPDLIKDVLIKDFASFANRGVRIFEKVEPLSANLVNLEAARWKPLRAKQTMMFTSAKLKEMFYLLLECADHLERALTEDNDVVDACEVTARYTTDCIGACVFGIDMKALEDDESDFRRIGKKFVQLDKWRAFKVRFKQIFPGLFNQLGFIMYDHEINDFFIGTMIKTMEHRRKNNIKRGDFVDLLNDLKQNPGKLEGIELTDELLTAQAFAFFFAGFDTSSLTISHALYELAINRSIQDRVRKEIEKVLAEYDGKLVYEGIESMKYLHKVLSETLRKYPVTPILTRQSMDSYSFSTGQLTIPKDTRIWIPIYGIHRDCSIYPDPETFDPERFSEENIRERHSSHYLPFGAGPRNCIGARFGNYQSKVGLITILKNFKVDVCEKTPIPYVSNRRRFLIGPAAGIPLRFTKIS
ncbi:probable cytochrome P450 6a13 [Copidosoma floridanum]|uniref:probable cytochrome P450 6a13 n=1 Tax=Copidosoma floridanum TaxID=29053 RepID=UPI0006C9992C|nr:probable cytochrome P450 6a13 [Copidosoma floridanum]